MTDIGLETPRRRPWLWTGLGVLLAGAIFSAGWAAQAVSAPPDDLVNDDAVATVAVSSGTLRSFLDVTVTASFSVSSTAMNRRAGTVTSLDFSAGASLEAGQTAYTVDLAPVSVAQGTIPMYRSLSEGAKGEDVAQLQRLLKELGYFASDAFGEFGPLTRSAVKRWQEASGEEPTGLVDIGRLVFVEELPTRVNPLAEFQVGDVVSGNEYAFDVLDAGVTFTAGLTENQARQIAPGQVVEITSPTASTWVGETGTVTVDHESGGYLVSVVPVDDAPLCGEGCESLPPDESGVTLRGRIVLQAEANGALVPTAAIISLGDGTAAVVGVDGDPIQITVIAGANGQSLVEGVAIGTEVRAPVEDEK